MRDKIEQALEPPLSFRIGGTPVGFSDEEMWDGWEAAARSPIIR